MNGPETLLIGMIQKNSGSLRKPPMKSSNGSGSPTLRSASSLSSLRKKYLRSGSISTSSSSRSASPTRSSSSLTDPFARKVRILRSCSNESPTRRQESYTGTISVVIRPKPVANRERDPWHIRDGMTISHDEAGEFTFDRVFPANCTNLDIYEASSRPMIDKLLQGFNATVFAYGMTGSGKTFTMTGTEDEAGLIPLSVTYLFSKILEQSMRGTSKYEVVVSYLEIYNEKIYDLLDCESENKFNSTPSRMFLSGTPRSSGGPVELRIRDDLKYGVRITGLTEKRCESSEELSRWIQIGDKNRKTSETIYNTRSSRSHAIVLVRLNNTDLRSGETVSSTLSLCDLAGSEKAVSQYERRKEGAFINKSLLALGTVISKLSSESLSKNGPPTFTSTNPTEPNTHIPYRDSKLTRILQPALSGNSIITTICTIDTRNEAASETVNTIRFASRAKNVTLQVAKRPAVGTGSYNEKDQTIENLTQQLEEQHQLVMRLKQRTSMTSSSHNDGSTVDPNSTLLKAENRVLKCKLSNCEKLLDKDTIELEDSEMVAIMDMLPIDVGSVLETKFQGLESQLRQYKEYTKQLEFKLMNFDRRENVSAEPFTAHVNSVIQSKDVEILELRRSLERKDKMIEALQSVKRLRERALKPIENKDEVVEHRERGKYF